MGGERDCERERGSKRVCMGAHKRQRKRESRLAR